MKLKFSASPFQEDGGLFVLEDVPGGYAKEIEVVWVDGPIYLGEAGVPDRLVHFYRYGFFIDGVPCYLDMGAKTINASLQKNLKPGLNTLKSVLCATANRKYHWYGIEVNGNYAPFCIEREEEHACV